MDNTTTFVITIPNENIETNVVLENNTAKEVALNAPYRFVDQLRSIVLTHYQDEEFGINELCEAIGFSRSQLHNKVKASTGMSTSIYIRFIRLEKAKELLENSDLNISEIAYEVGFKDPSYFSRLFNEVYGIAPSRLKLVA